MIELSVAKLKNTFDFKFSQLFSNLNFISLHK